MAAGLYALALQLTGVFAASAPFVLQLIALGALIALGMVAYFALAHVTGAQPMGQLLRRLRRAK